MRTTLLCGISICFQMLSPASGQVTYVLLTRPPLVGDQNQSGASTINQLGQRVRLACIRHTAGVHPEPGSNSHIKQEAWIALFNKLSELTSQMFLPRSLRSRTLHIWFVETLFSFQRSTADQLSQPAYWLYHERFSLSRSFLINFLTTFRSLLD